MEETSEHGILGRHQSCSEERIEVLSNTIERCHSSRNTSSSFVFRKLFGWELETSYTRKYMRHLVLLQRSPCNMTWKENWVQKLFDNQKEKLLNNPKIPNQTNQIQTQIMIERWHPLCAATQGPRKVQEKTSRSQEIETRSFHAEAVEHDRTGTPVVGSDPTTAQGARKNVPFSGDRNTIFFNKKLLNMIERGHPLFAVTQVTRKEPPKHVPLMQARTSTLETKQIMIERGHPLFTVTQITSTQCETRWTVTSEYLDCHILLWNKLRTLVFVSSYPHRHTFQRDLQQNKAYNPFSTTTKKMIQDVGNVEIFELFETDPKTQCTECLSYWSEGIVFCTCGHLLKEIVANRGFIELTLVLLSIPEYVSKKGRLHCHRYGEDSRKERISSGP